MPQFPASATELAANTRTVPAAGTALLNRGVVLPGLMRRLILFCALATTAVALPASTISRSVPSSRAAAYAAAMGRADRPQLASIRVEYRASLNWA